MLATAASYEARGGGSVRIEWIPRSLREFGMTPVDELAREFDLIVMDHPHIGAVAESGCAVALDTVLEPGVLEAIGADSPGGSHESYEYGGHQWALAVDAACQAGACRPDLLDSLPATWDEVIELSQGGKVLWPLCDVDAAASLLTIAASCGRPAGTEPDRMVDRDVGRQALEVMRAVATASDPFCLRANPIDTLEAMSGSDRFVYAPLTFCYVSYARLDGAELDRPGPSTSGPSDSGPSDSGPSGSEPSGSEPSGSGPSGSGPSGRHRIAYGPIPRLGDGAATGALLGGAGLVVSALRASPEVAADYAAFVAGEQVQRGEYFTSGGQPAHGAAWRDTALDARAGGFFSAVGPTIRSAWTRPRFPAFAVLQNEMIELFSDWLDRSRQPDALLDELDAKYRDVLRRAGESRSG
jgi:multiple sugar transport system substrate-binding protein